MKYKEFLEEIKEICYVDYELGTGSEYIYKSWRTGGLTGGSCWGTSADTPIEADSEPEWDELDTILEKYWPSITYLQYKKLILKAKVETETVDDYYGNYTIYTKKKMYLRDLYDVIHP